MFMARDGMGICWSFNTTGFAVSLTKYFSLLAIYVLYVLYVCRVSPGSLAGVCNSV